MSNKSFGGKEAFKMLLSFKNSGIEVIIRRHALKILRLKYETEKSKINTFEENRLAFEKLPKEIL